MFCLIFVSGLDWIKVLTVEPFLFSSSPGEAIIIPAKGVPATAATNVPQSVGGISNPGYDPFNDMESIEVNLDFDDDDHIDTPDEFDMVDNNDLPPSPMESFTQDTPSIHSENFYEELEPLSGEMSFL